MVRIQAAEENIYATVNHCFYIEGKGWIEAGDIQVGDLLVLQDGEQVVALSIQYEVLETPIKVYNLTVEGLHNYYAGEMGVLVHNTCKRDELLNAVNNKKLKNTINEMYREGATVGDGGLGDSIRYEINTGGLVGGKSHIQKGIERLMNLGNILRKETLSDGDMDIAIRLIIDLQKALNGK